MSFDPYKDAMNININDLDEYGNDIKKEQKEFEKQENIKKDANDQIDSEVAGKLGFVRKLLYAEIFDDAKALLEEAEQMEKNRASSKGFCDNPEVYWCKVLLTYEARDEADLISKQPDLEHDKYYKLAVTCCKTEEQKQAYRFVLDKINENRSQNTYQQPRGEKSKPAAKRDAQPLGEEEIKKRLRRISHIIDAGDFDEAKERLNRLERELGDDCEIPQVYHYKMLLDYEACNDEELIARLVEKREDITKNKNYKYAKNYADDIDDEDEFDALLAIKKKSTDGIAKAKAEAEANEKAEAERKRREEADFDIQDGVLVAYKGKGGNVVIPDSVTEIAKDSFSECESITSLTIGKNVKTINGMSYDSPALASINVKEGNLNFKSIDGNLYSFDGKTLITYAWGKTAASFKVPDGVTTIGDEAFSDCSSLTKVTIPNSVATIGARAFMGCESLKSVVIGNNVTVIGETAFCGCQSLASIILPDGVTTIGEYAFYGCKSLTNIIIPDSVTTIGKYAFSYCTSLTSATIGNGVTTINERAFEKCEALTWVTIGNGTITIGGYAFFGCKALTSVTIPDSVTTIGKMAFYGCGALSSVIISNSVTNIEYSAFGGCNSLKYVYCRASSKPQGWHEYWVDTYKTQVIWDYKG